MIIQDTKKAIVAKVDFVKNHAPSSISKFFGKSSQVPIEYNKVEIKIFKKELGKEIMLGEGTGNWTRFVQFDMKIYWQQNQPVQTLTPEPFELSLPSSSLRRPELKLIDEKKYAEADKSTNKIG